MLHEYACTDSQALPLNTCNVASGFGPTMSLSTWVQLFRNAFCVMKSLLPASSVFQLPYFADSSFYPLTITTAIELLIAPTQFAAVIFNCMSGFGNVNNGKDDLIRVEKWLAAINRVFLLKPFKSSSAEFLVIKAGLESDKAALKIRIFIGYLEIVFGIAFLFLVLNSLHIVGPSHPKPVIDALIWMEVGLVYILMIMWRSFTKKVKNIQRLGKYSAFVKAMKVKTAEDLLLRAIDSGFDKAEIFEGFVALHPSYAPAWRQKGSSDTNTGAKDAVNKALSEEIQTEFRTVTAAFSKFTSIEKSTTGSDKEQQSLSLTLEKQSYEARLEAPLELIFFVLNFTAWYGYLLGILAFYVPEAARDASLGITDYAMNSIQEFGAPHSWCKVLMFGLSHGDADWWGNLAGDMAWTIEPLLMLIQRPIIGYLVRSRFSQKRPVGKKAAGKKKNE